MRKNYSWMGLEGVSKHETTTRFDLIYTILGLVFTLSCSLTRTTSFGLGSLDPSLVPYWIWKDNYIGPEWVYYY